MTGSRRLPGRAGRHGLVIARRAPASGIPQSERSVTLEESLVEHLPDRVDVIEVLYREDPELARAVIERYRRLIRRLRDRLAELVPSEELEAILGDEDLELIEGVLDPHSSRRPGDDQQL